MGFIRKLQFPPLSKDILIGNLDCPSGLYQGTNGLTNASTFSGLHQEYSSYPGFSQGQYAQYYSTSYNSPYVPSNNISPSAIPTTTYSLQESSHHISNQSSESLSGDYNTHNGPSTPVKDSETDRQHRGSDVKLRGRSKRNNDPSPSVDNEIERVFVWDLDETIIIFHSLLTGTFATRYGKSQKSPFSKCKKRIAGVYYVVSREDWSTFLMNFATFRKVTNNESSENICKS
ncbi:unnamed protein product [Ranitomeya imitator]|uniref:Eyes absent homolog n=1 Tax=Ranitomeya imitator TaxID=111125 RepID=A0ABN9LCU2_9NEOB|nr:unnamed protein product [Ranitomeya imitator]